MLIGNNCKRSKSDSSLDSQPHKRKKLLWPSTNVAVPFTIHEDEPTGSTLHFTTESEFSKENVRNTKVTDQSGEKEGLIHFTGSLTDGFFYITRLYFVNLVAPNWERIAEERRVALDDALTENRIVSTFDFVRCLISLKYSVFLRFKYGAQYRF